MRHELETTNSDNMAHLVPKLQLISDTYNQSIANQRKENALLQQRLTELKKDKSLMQRQIDEYTKQIEHMECNIGMWIVYQVWQQQRIPNTKDKD